MLSISLVMNRLGLATKSTAPSSRARNTLAFRA